MKIFLTICLLFVASVVIAQTRVLSRKALNEKDYLEIVNRYPSATANSQQEELAKKLDSVITSSLPKNPGGSIGLSVQAFVNSKGTVDHIVFDLEDASAYNKDSLRNILHHSLTKDFSGWTLSQPSSPFGLSTYRMMGKAIAKRQVRNLDSTLVELKDAISYKDTLRIKRLYLHQLELKSIPDVIYRFPNLEELYLSTNQIQSANINCKRFPKLKQLHLQENALTNESLRITRNKSLRIVNLSENRFTDIPDAVRNCKGMTSLWLGGNKVTDLSNASFKKLKKVKDLNFYKSGITILPSGIRKMRKLEVLDLYYNNLSTLPNSVTKLKNLSQLAVSHNQLTALPKKIYKLKRVNTLYVHHNHLSVLPERISKLQDIRILDLGYNWFTNFPNEVTSFGKLSELDLSANNFVSFPEQLLDIKKLDKLYLRGNPFIDKQIEVTYKGELTQLKDKNIEVFY
jgi:Leucine-rich repeat (LRR) protein